METVWRCSGSFLTLLGQFPGGAPDFVQADRAGLLGQAPPEDLDQGSQIGAVRVGEGLPTVAGLVRKFYVHRPAMSGHSTFYMVQPSVGGASCTYPTRAYHDQQVGGTRRRTGGGRHP